MKEFSKKVVVAMVILWFVVSIFAMFIVYRDSINLDALLSFIGMPVASTLVLYMGKSAFENNAKIKSNPDFLKDNNPPDPPQFGEDDSQ